jgi:hypothetical protein
MSKRLFAAALPTCLVVEPLFGGQQASLPSELNSSVRTLLEVNALKRVNQPLFVSDHDFGVRVQQIL